MILTSIYCTNVYTHPYNETKPKQTKSPQNWKRENDRQKKEEDKFQDLTTLSITF